jgi:predicted ABC-type ATPase
VGQLSTSASRRVLVIAGPNGAGKTTFAHEFLPAEAGLISFVNADLIAAGLSPFDPDRAAVRAGRRYARAIPRWQAAGYRVGMVFIALPSAEIALARVAGRVRQGGHSVPEAVVRRRFAAGRENFEQIHKGLVDEWRLYDNSGPRPVLVDQGENR